MSDETKTIEQRVRRIAYEQLYGVNTDKPDDDESIKTTDLLSAHGADSLDMVEIVMFVEQEFEVEIPSDDAAGFHTIDNIVRYLESRVKESDDFLGIGGTP